MKLLRNATVALLLIGTGAMTTGCFGSFQLTRNFYQWHDSTIENKFLKTLLFYIPFGFVYTATAFVDVVVLNLIEFWSGSNPMSMNEGDYEVEYKTYAGINYKLEAIKNQFIITPLEGENQGQTTIVRFDEDTKTWLYQQNNESIALMTFDGEEYNDLTVYAPNGELVKFDLTQEYNQQDIAATYKEALEHSTVAQK